MSLSVEDATFEHMPSCLVVLDGEGRIAAANRAWRKRIEARGGPADGLMDRPYLEVGAPAIGLDPADPLIASVAAGRLAGADIEYGPSGAEGPGWLRLTGTPLPTGGNGHRLLAHDDITGNHEADALHRAMIENSTDLVFVLRRDATIAFVGPSASELLGQPAESMTGRLAFDIVHPDDLAIAAGAFARGVAKPGSKTPLLTIRLQHADGSWRPFELQGRSLTAPVKGGSILVSARDATARVKAEREAERAQALLQSVFDHSPLALLLCDPDDRVMLANDEFKDGYPALAAHLEGGASFEALVRAAAAAGQVDTAVVTAADVEMFVAQRIIAHQAADGTPFLRQLADGRHVQVFEKRLPGGETLSVGVDVSAIVRSTEAAAASEARLRSILDNIADMVVTIDDRGHILSFNAAAEQAFGYSEQEIIGRNVSLLADQPDRDRHDGYIAAFIRSGQGSIIGKPAREVTAIRKSGERFAIALAVSEARIGGQRVFIGSMRDVDERRRLTRALEESELRFRIAFDQAPIGMSLTAPDGTLLRVNRTICDFLGYSEAELLATSFRDMTDPADFAAQAAEARRLRRGEIPFMRLEKRYRRKDGTLAWGDLTVACVRKEDGKPDYYISIIQDIRQRKAAEEALRSREQQLRLIADNVPLIIIYFDHELRYVFANQTTAEWYGMPLDRIVGRKVVDVLPPATYARLEPHILGALQGRRIRTTESVLYPDGRERLVEFNYQPHTDAGGQVVGAIVVVNDIGERQEMIRALRRRDREFRTIADHFPGLIGYCDTDLNLRFINRGGAAWYGRQPEDLIGRPVEAFLPADHWEPYRRMLERVLQGHSTHGEMSFTYPDGQVRLVDLIHMPDRAEDGSIRGVFTFVFDLTERRQVEEQLRQIQKMEAVGQLTGGIAHDFNNLLGVIVGNLDLLTRQLEATPRAQALVERAIAAAERGAALTQRLLAFSRRQALRPQPVHANRLIGESVALLQRTLGEAISIVTHEGEGLWSCMVDAPQLESALLNLAINARDAMPGGGRISIETANAVLDQDYAARNREVAPGDYVCISVSDTGTGMSPDVLARAFDPFFTTKAIGKGTGLGLSMVYGFVKQSGGHVRIYSEPGHGTSVRLYLPRTPQDRAGEDKTPDSGEALPMGDGELVLVVEDNAAMLDFTVSALATLGYRALTAGDAGEARAALDAHRDIAVLFSDLVLPGGTSGFELAAEVRARKPRLPILLMSGFSEKSLAGSGHPLLAGIEILQKPYRIRELGARLRQILRDRA